MKKPNKLDWLIYKIFYWRWNPILASNIEMAKFFSRQINDFNKREFPGIGWVAVFDDSDYIWYFVPQDYYNKHDSLPDYKLDLPELPPDFKIVTENGADYTGDQDNALYMLSSYGFSISYL